MLVFTGTNGTGFICLKFSLGKVLAHMDHLIVNFITRLYDLYSNVAVLNIWVGNALNVTTLNFIERHNLVVLSVVIFEQTVNEFFTCF